MAVPRDRVKTKTCSDVGTDILECTWMLGGLAEPKCERLNATTTSAPSAGRMATHPVHPHADVLNGAVQKQQHS